MPPQIPAPKHFDKNWAPPQILSLKIKKNNKHHIFWYDRGLQTWSTRLILLHNWTSQDHQNSPNCYFGLNRNLVKRLKLPPW